MNVISAKDAAAKGDKLYFTGRQCRNGHIAPRYVSCGVCKECASMSLSGTRKLRREAFKARFSGKRTLLIEVSDADFEATLTMLRVCNITWKDPQAVKSAKTPLQFLEWFDDGYGQLTHCDPNTGKLIMRIHPDGTSTMADGTPGPRYDPPAVTGQNSRATSGPPEGFDPRR